MSSFESTYRRVLSTDRPPEVSGPLLDYWELPVETLCDLKEPWEPTPPWEERHRVYSYLLMALTYHYWNGYKYGRPRSDGDYPLNDRAGFGDPTPFDTVYYGHNIAALAVDSRGYVLDFAFNHNDLFNSSAEHAEARLVRRLYSHAQISDAWGALPTAGPPTPRLLEGDDRRRIAGESYGNEAALVAADKPLDDVRRTSLKGVTVYTSLESCAQCAGVMALAQIQQVIYLQTDPQFFFIGRILRNLTTDKLRAPLPISGAEIKLGAETGAEIFAELDQEFGAFVSAQKLQKGDAFWRGGDRPYWSPSITSFLCTAKARDIFRRGGSLLNAELRYADFGGASSASGKMSTEMAQPLTNAKARVEAVHFLDYATRKGLRGTPHNL